MSNGDRGAPPLQITAPVRGGWRSPPDLRQNLETTAVRQRHKRIIICADGTWNRARSAAIGESETTNV
jgi:uncharacterized protein (DUF2235 family)